MSSTRPRRSPAWSLALLALGALITALDYSVVYVALPDIARSVGFSPRDLQWVVSAYAIVYGGFLLLGGLTECIGCGCLSLDRCVLANRDDRAARLGAGPRYWLGDPRPD